jgi:hypothetical protein
MTDSIYDQLNAYGTVAKQRFVETFSGDALDTDRWEQTIVGSSTGAMADSVNGGYLLSVNASGASIAIHFNDKTQYSGASSTFISVVDSTVASDPLTQWGLVEDKANIGLLNSKSGYIFGISNNVHYCYTANGTRGYTNMSISVDGDAHAYQAVRSGSNCEFYYDGVLNATRTDYLPTVALQPAFQLQWNSQADTSNIRYMECYNT